MVVDIHKLIAAINPDVYCIDDEVEKDGRKMSRRKAVKERINELFDQGARDPYIKAADEFAKPKEPVVVDLFKWFNRNLMDYKMTFKNPIEKHFLSYDSFGESLEPIYFWILDTLNNLGLSDQRKLVDNFISSPGSGHFSEMGMKQTKMQEEGMKMLGAANQVVKSILNIIYDLKEFKIRLSTYDDLNSEDQAKKDAAMFGLKQIWMDSVDAKRGTTSLKGLVQNFDYVTIIDAFMVADSLEKLKELDLNERVKRILEQRLADFLKWLTESERELRKRYEIEKTYLKSQYNTVQLYAKWAKPYLRAAKQLSQNASPSVSLLNMINTTILELVILAKGKYDPTDDVNSKNLPQVFRGKNKKDIGPLVLIEFKFRTAPEKFGQNYGFRGRVDMTFTGYALSKDELDVLQDQIEWSDFGDILEMIEGSTTESLEQIKEDVDKFLSETDEKEKKDKKKKDESSDDTNPFSALFSVFEKETKKEDKKDKGKDKKPKKLNPDDPLEKVIRGQCIYTSRQRCAKIYEVYKAVHKMPGFSVTGDLFG